MEGIMNCDSCGSRITNKGCLCTPVGRVTPGPPADVERYYNGPKSKLMDELYDRLTEHGDPSEYPDWSILSLYIAREIEQIEVNHAAALSAKDGDIQHLRKELAFEWSKGLTAS